MLWRRAHVRCVCAGMQRSSAVAAMVGDDQKYKPTADEYQPALNRILAPLHDGAVFRVSPPRLCTALLRIAPCKAARGPCRVQKRLAAIKEMLENKKSNILEVRIVYLKPRVATPCYLSSATARGSYRERFGFIQDIPLAAHATQLLLNTPYAKRTRGESSAAARPKDSRCD